MKTKLFLLFLFILGAFLRLYRLNSYPPLLWDEAALGYNSYSILKTGRDEFGQTLPLIFKSFGDYKPGLYIYLTLPFVKLLGLSVLSVRLPSVIFGLISCYLLYLILKNFGEKFAVAAAAIALFFPWSIHFSRGAWESNLATMLLLLSYYLYSQNRYIFSSLILGLNLYAYQSSKFFCLAFLLYFLISNFRTKNILAKLVIPIFLLSLPLLFGVFSGNDANRLKILSILSYPQTTTETAKIQSLTGPFLQKVFFNNQFYFLREIVRRYLNNFSPQFLFWQGDWQNPRHSAPYVGLLLWPLIWLLPLGLLKASVGPKRKINLFFLFWLLIAPLPAALTRDEIQANRTLGLFLPISYFSTIGYVSLKNNFYKYFTIFIFFLSLGYYVDLYHIHMVQKSPDQWLSGYQTVVELAQSHHYDQIYFTDFYGQPYIYFLFFSQYNPLNYQQKNHFKDSASGDVGSVSALDNISFGSFSFNNIRNKPNSLIVLSRDELLRQGLNFNQFKAIAPESGVPNFYAYLTQP